MRTPRSSSGPLVAAGAMVGAGDQRRAAPADPPLTREEYEQRIQQLEDAIKDLRKDTRQIQVAEEEKSKLKPIAGYDNGFFLQTPDGANKINVGGYVHFDGRYFLNGDDAGHLAVSLPPRPYRPEAARSSSTTSSSSCPTSPAGRSVIQDAYLNVNYVPWARVQAGKYKTPFGIERLQSANALMFIERALPNNLVPNRDLGFMLLGPAVLRRAWNISSPSSTASPTAAATTPTSASATTRPSPAACSSCR